MILFGDGHSNVVHQDSFANPSTEEFDVVLTNPPYSQRTRHGNLYPIPSPNGDAVAMQHCFLALKPGGRAAVLVKEDFLTKGGEVGRVRDLILSSTKNVSIVSLPRRLFEPYTPTKTSIIYFEKNGQRNSTFFFIVHNVGHTFGARQLSTQENDLPHVLESIRSPIGDFTCDGFVVENELIREAGNSLWPYNYKEVLPSTGEHLVPLEDHIQKSGTRFNPSDFPEEEFKILGVGNRRGVYLHAKKGGDSINQTYIRVSAGDLVYNPHRVNVGSIGIVPKELNGGIVSGIYVVFRPRNPVHLPAPYLLSLLKSDIYLKIIRAYDTTGAVRASLKYEQLGRIKLVLPSSEMLREFKSTYRKIENLRGKVDKMVVELSRIVSGEQPIHSLPDGTADS